MPDASLLGVLDHDVQQRVPVLLMKVSEWKTALDLMSNAAPDADPEIFISAEHGEVWFYPRNHSAPSPRVVGELEKFGVTWDEDNEGWHSYV